MSSMYQSALNELGSVFAKIDDAIDAIDEAILLDPKNDYYLNQKEKFKQSNI